MGFSSGLTFFFGGGVVREEREREKGEVEGEGEGEGEREREIQRETSR